MTTRGPEFIAVPAGTRRSQCNGPTCRAVIYFVEHPRTGRPHPVDCDVEGGEHPSEPVDPRQLSLDGETVREHDGRGVSHFATCPDADHFRSRRTAHARA